MTMEKLDAHQHLGIIEGLYAHVPSKTQTKESPEDL